MNRLNRHRLEMLESLLQFATDHPNIVAANTRAATLFAALPAIIATLRSFSRNQTSGHRTYRAGAEERATVATQLRKALRKIHNIAQVLDPSEHPGIRQKFKMPIDSYRALADSGRAFLQHATPIAQVFIDRGRPATFLTELEALVTTMESAAQYKIHGRLQQVAGTAGIESEARRGVRIMRELNAILTDLLEENEPLLAAWKTATHVEHPSKSEAESRNSTPKPSTNPVVIAARIPTIAEAENPNGGRAYSPLLTDPSTLSSASTGSLLPATRCTQSETNEADAT